MKLVAFVGSPNIKYPINFGEVCEYIDMGKRCYIRPLSCDLVFTNVPKELIYFPNHDKGYNQPCFK